MRDFFITIGVLFAVVALATAGKKKKKPKADTEGISDETISPFDSPSVMPPGSGWLPPGEGTPPPAFISGDPNNPEIVGMLNELDTYLAENGVDLTTVSALELTTMPEGTTQPSGKKPVAIPSKDLWANIVPTLWLWQERIRNPMGIPMNIRAYRPPDYNEAVGGAPRSAHQWFSAIDITLAGPGNTEANRVALGRLGAQAYLSTPDTERVGFGAYGQPVPRRIHLDTRYQHRRWEDAQYFIDQVQDAVS